MTSPLPPTDTDTWESVLPSRPAELTRMDLIRGASWSDRWLAAGAPAHGTAGSAPTTDGDLRPQAVIEPHSMPCTDSEEAAGYTTDRFTASHRGSFSVKLVTAPYLHVPFVLPCYLAHRICVVRTYIPRSGSL